MQSVLFDLGLCLTLSRYYKKIGCASQMCRPRAECTDAQACKTPLFCIVIYFLTIRYMYKSDLVCGKYF